MYFRITITQKVYKTLTVHLFYLKIGSIATNEATQKYFTAIPKSNGVKDAIYPEEKSTFHYDANDNNYNDNNNNDSYEQKEFTNDTSDAIVENDVSINSITHIPIRIEYSDHNNNNSNVLEDDVVKESFDIHTGTKLFPVSLIYDINHQITPM